MKKYKIIEKEENLTDLVWKNEPMGSGELVKLCEKEMNWKKSAIYTILKKLCEKGIYQNENAIVTSLMTRDEYPTKQSIIFVKDTFRGSLPQFITAFISDKKLSKYQAEELKKLTDRHKEV